MKNFYIILFFILNSCQFFSEKQLTEKETLDKRIKEIDWNKVDKLPSFPQCEVLKDEIAQQNCFFDFLKQTVIEKLKSNDSNLNSDSIKIKVRVFADGNFEFVDFNKNPILDSILKVKLANFPRANPAIKRGAFVKTQFDLDLKGYDL